MCAPHTDGWTRRRFLGGLTLAGTAGLLGLSPRPATAEPPPETTRLRLHALFVTCLAPQWVAQDLLDSEGFTGVQYVREGSQTQNHVPESLLAGEVDISLSFVPSDLISIDAGDPVVILAASHIGCVEVFGSDRVSSTRDLKGKRVGVERLRSDAQIFLSMFAAYVGLDPQKDINWFVDPNWRDPMRLLAEGKIDALMMGPAFSLEWREEKIGHVLATTTTDKPWSQYFCGLVASTRAFSASTRWRPSVRCGPC